MLFITIISIEKKKSKIFVNNHKEIWSKQYKNKWTILEKVKIFKYLGPPPPEINVYFVFFPARVMNMMVCWRSPAPTGFNALLVLALFKLNFPGLASLVGNTTRLSMFRQPTLNSCQKIELYRIRK